MLCGTRDSLLLERVDTHCRATETCITSHPHFDKDNRVTFTRHQIHFAVPIACIAREHAASGFNEVLRGGILRRIAGLLLQSTRLRRRGSR